MLKRKRGREIEPTERRKKEKEQKRENGMENFTILLGDSQSPDVLYFLICYGGAVEFSAMEEGKKRAIISYFREYLFAFYFGKFRKYRSFTEKEKGDASIKVALKDDYQNK